MSPINEGEARVSVFSPVTEVIDGPSPDLADWAFATWAYRAWTEENFSYDHPDVPLHVKERLGRYAYEIPALTETPVDRWMKRIH